MEKLFVTTTENPKVLVSVRGNLRLKGEDELEVTVKSSDPNAVRLEQDGDVVTVHCDSDCKIWVPRQAQVQVTEAHGDAVLKALEGEVSVLAVHGNLVLRSVGRAVLGAIHGNVEAKNVEGDLEIERIEGNATIRDVQGDLTAKIVRGNVQIHETSGSITAAAEGNISLELDPDPGETYTFTAKGNVVCNVPEDASLELEVVKAGGRITVNLADVPDAKNVKAPYTVTIGEGDAHMTLSAGGNILISGQVKSFEMPDFEMEFESTFEGMGEALGQQIEQQIEAQMRMLEDQLNTQVSNITMKLGAAGLSPEQLERIQQRAREASERASARAQEKMRRAQERLERQMASTQQRMERKARAAEAFSHRREQRGVGVGWSFGAGAASSQGHEPVSDEERLAVLRLLEQKKISLEEAESLLAALEGREG